jgi:arabinogalactan endo-1,4-beta-galactosidase
MPKPRNATRKNTRREGLLRRRSLLVASALLVFAAAWPAPLRAQQPAEPVDKTPIDGETYSVINQADGLQMDLNAGSIAPGANILQQSASFTSLSQRWAMTKLSDGNWKISNLLNGLCLDAAASSGTTWTVQNPCAANTASQEWALNPTSNGYYTTQNKSTGLVIDVAQGSTAAGAQLDQTAVNGAATQSQQWLLRPVFLHGIDNALLEKQEAARVSQNLTWWKDAGTAEDVLQMMKSHGINTVRLRPTSTPPYATQPANGPCAGNLCYAETDAQDLDLAKRAKNLGMSVELTLLFDGGSSQSMPAAWANDSFAQLQTDLYNYVFQEIESYRSSGVMPDLVAIGNEVDTGFLNGNDPGANFSNFAQLQIEGMKAVRAAAADSSIGPALPAPLVCIHITPAWDLTSFFAEANSNSIPYDAICQSYYPLYHGPLTQAQATAANPSHQPVEQTVLNSAASTIGKPIFIIETGEHYENGFGSNDPWYLPTSKANQRQFLIDLDAVLRSVPNNLAMGMEYWDPEGVNIPNPSGGFLNGDNMPNAIYSWNGLTIFDNADSSGTTNVNDSNYSALLPGADALSGKFDPWLAYKFVNRSTGKILEAAQGSEASGASLDTAADTGVENLYQQWRIASNGDSYFRITSANAGQSGVPNGLDDAGASTNPGSPVVQSSTSTSMEQEWDAVTAGGGYFNIVNRTSGLNLDISASTGLAIQQSPSSSSLTQQWEIVPVHITSAGAAGFLVNSDPPTFSIVQGSTGSATITLLPLGGYAGTATFACGGLPTSASCSFSPTSITFDGKDSVQATSLTITTQGTSAGIGEVGFPSNEFAGLTGMFLAAGVLLLGTQAFLQRRVRTSQRAAEIVLAAAIVCLLLAAACGSGSGSSGGTGPPPPPPTPLGTSVVVVTANATGSGAGNANSAQSTAIFLNVIQ